jgi:hypothetical protein
MQGRPRAADSRARHARFLELVAAGRTPYDAAREARIDPWRALRLVCEHDLVGVVRALREAA